MSIRSFLDISTAHITERDASILDEMSCNLTIIPYQEYGWFIHVPDKEQLQFMIGDIKDSGLSRAFIQIITYAQEKGCDYILFDRDAPTISHLPIYDW